MSNSNSIIEGHVKFRDNLKWKSRWCVMRKLSPVADCIHLQLYRDSKDRFKHGQTKASLSLQHFLGIESGFTLDKESNTIAIICKDIVVVLAFDARERLFQWQAKITNNLGENIQYSIFVSSCPSRVKISQGPAKLHIQNQKFCITSGNPPKLIKIWYIEHLRRYGVIGNQFCFEVGSSCGEDEGVYMFVTNKGDDITNTLQSASKGNLIFEKGYSPRSQINSDTSSFVQSSLSCMSKLNELSRISIDIDPLENYDVPKTPRCFSKSENDKCSHFADNYDKPKNLIAKTEQEAISTEIKNNKECDTKGLEQPSFECNYNSVSSLSDQKRNTFLERDCNFVSNWINSPTKNQTSVDQELISSEAMHVKTNEDILKRHTNQLEHNCVQNMSPILNLKCLQVQHNYDNYENSEFVKSLSFYENIQNVERKVLESNKSNQLCTKCGNYNSNNSDSSNINSNSLLFGNTQNTIELMNSISVKNESQNCFRNSNTDSIFCNYNKSGELSFHRRNSEDNFAESSPITNTIQNIRRSSSVPCKKNRDSSSSNDSGFSMSTTIIKQTNRNYDSNSFELPLTDLSSSQLYEKLKDPNSVRTNAMNQSNLPKRAKSYDPFKDLSFEFDKEIKFSSAEAEIPVHISNGSQRKNCRNAYNVMDSRSTSSGTSDLSDYFETLSLASFSSADISDHKRVKQQPKKSSTSAAAILKPRFGKEYHKINSIELLDKNQ